MNIMNIPPFKGGLKALCDIHSFCSLLTLEGGLGPKRLFKLINAPTSPYPGIIDLLQGRISKLNNSSSEAAKIKSIFIKLIAKPRTPDLLWETVQELEWWIDSYKSKTILPIEPDLAILMSGSPLILIEKTRPNIPSNACSVEQIRELLNLSTDLLSRIKIANKYEGFEERVLWELFSLLALREGRELIKSIIDLLGDKRLKIIAGTDYEADFDYPKIRLAKTNVTCIYECPDSLSPGKTVLKSQLTPKVVSLAHELLHILHQLKGIKQIDYPEGSERARIYTNEEEERTIRGSPTSLTSENTFGRAYNLYPRYGHRPGSDKKDSPKEKLERAVSIGIDGDLPGIISSTPPSSLSALYQQNHDQLKLEVSPEKFKETRKHLKRVLEKNDETTESLKEPKIQKMQNSLLTLDIAAPIALRATNRIEILKRIQLHLKDSKFDTTNLLPPSPMAVEES